MSYFVFGSSDYTFLKMIKLNNRKLRNISKRHLPILKNIQPRGNVGFCLRVFVLQGKRDTLEKNQSSFLQRKNNNNLYTGTWIYCVVWWKLALQRSILFVTQFYKNTKFEQDCSSSVKIKEILSEGVKSSENCPFQVGNVE